MPPASANHGRRQQQASAYTSGYAPGSSSSSSTTSTPLHRPSGHAELFRSLVFDGSVPLCVCLASDELPSGSDRSVESIYIQAHRITYLPLLIPDIRRGLLDLVLDENDSALLRDVDLWFECHGEPLKWHWPIGLVHDYLRANRGQSPSPPPAGTRLAGPIRSTSMGRNPSYNDEHSPLRIILHLRDPPLDKLLMSSSTEGCRTNFMNQLKEADFVRWGSVRRVISLKKVDQDSLWESLVSHDFHRFWAVASKLVPSPPSSLPSRNNSTSPVLSTVSTFDAGSRMPDASAMKSIPLRIYLPHGGPVIQDVLPPICSPPPPTGIDLPPSEPAPQTLATALSTLVPALFPPQPPSGDFGMASSFVSTRRPLIKRCIVQGIDLPLDAELAWCAACLAYPDGWLGIVIEL